MNAQGCFLELEKQTGYGRMIFKYCKNKKTKKKQTKQTNKRIKRTQNGSECISKREFWHFLDYRLD